MDETKNVNPDVWRFGRLELVATLSLFLILFALFTGYKIIRTDQMRGDSAMYLQGTENLATRGAPVSQVQASIIDFLNRNTYTSMSADEIAKNPVPLFGTSSSLHESSILLGHAYFILYAIAPIAKVFPVRVVLLTLYALTFTGMLTLAYFLLRTRRVGVIAAALFCLLIVSHPAWWQGLLWGQFYPDRLFVLFGFVFMGLVSRLIAPKLATTPSRIWLAIAATICASINERGALVAGLFVFLYVVFYWKKPGLDRFYKLALGLALIFYGYAAIKWLVPTDATYSRFLPTTFGGLWEATQAPRFAPLMRLFLLENAPLLIFACFEWRAAAIACILMLPNVFGSIGGAEKTGWATHYPSFFFTPLAWAAVCGFAAFYERVKLRKLLPVAYAAPAVFLLIVWMINGSVADPLSVSSSNLSTSVLPTFADQAQVYLLQPDSRQSLVDAVDGIAQAVPEGAVVSSVEAGMPLLYHRRTIEFFPKDIDNADYAVLGASQIDGKIQYNGAVSALGPAESQKLDDLVVARMKRDGYDLEHPKLFPAFAGLAVVRRIH